MSLTGKGGQDDDVKEKLIPEEDGGLRGGERGHGSRVSIASISGIMRD